MGFWGFRGRRARYERCEGESAAHRAGEETTVRCGTAGSGGGTDGRSTGFRDRDTGGKQERAADGLCECGTDACSGINGTADSAGCDARERASCRDVRGRGKHGRCDCTPGGREQCKSCGDICDKGNAVALFEVRDELCDMQGGDKTLWCGKELRVTLRVLSGRERDAEYEPAAAERVITVLDGECEITVRRGKFERRLRAVRGSTVAVPRGACCDILNPRGSSRTVFVTVWARRRAVGATPAVTQK